MGLYQEISALYPSFNKIPQEHLENISEVVFSWRDGVDSICVVFRTPEALRAIAPNVPLSITNRKANRYAADLESIGSTRERYYVDVPSDPVISIMGWFCNNGVIEQEKEYRRAGESVLEVDRYNGEGEMISSAEPEVETLESEWRGRPEVLTIVKSYPEESAGFIVLKKTLTDQTYIRLYGIN